MLYRQGTLEHCVPLSPYAVWNECTVCRGHELFYAHQIKSRTSYYFSFSSGHEISADLGELREPPAPRVALGMTAPSGSQMAAAAGWRKHWPDLARPLPRLLARAADLALAALLSLLVLMLCLLLGAPFSGGVAASLTALVGYEPCFAYRGTTPGKRLMRIEPISVRHRRPLNRGDRLLRAFWLDLQLLIVPLAVRSLAWLLWDPARQCLHDRRTESLVVAGLGHPLRRT